MMTELCFAGFDPSAEQMPPPAPSNTPVSLAHMLARREARVASQQALLSRFGRPLLQLTLVNPGPVKDTAQARFVFEQGLLAIRQALASADHANPIQSEGGACVLKEDGGYFVTGPEILMVLDAEPPYLKDLMLQIEDHHALGRLWDIDVLDASGSSLSRQQLGWPARRCLLCDQSAHACARSRQHPLAELQRAMEDKVNAFRRHLAR